MATFTFNNNNSGSVYFIYETIRNTNGVYDSTSVKAAVGVFGMMVNIDGTKMVKSDYIWGAVIPSGESSLVFTPSNPLPEGVVKYSITGNATYEIER